MTDNVTFPNGFPPPQNPSSNHSISENDICYFSEPIFIIFTTYNITHISLLLPLCIVILCYGLQRQLQKHSSASLTSHSDWFTYHAVIMELFGVTACFLRCFGDYKVNFKMFLVSVLFHNFNWAGQTCFHILTCVERYLAVVHPVTYLSLRNDKGIRIRNISIGCVWLICVVGVGLGLTKVGFLIGNIGLLVLALTTVSFCSIAVLCNLIGPGPGEQAGGRERADQSKRRAFYTIMAILGVLVMRFSFALIQVILSVSNVSGNCILQICEFWLNLHSSLVLPLLFLQRAGKLGCFKRNQSTDQQSNSEK